MRSLNTSEAFARRGLDRQGCWRDARSLVLPAIDRLEVVEPRCRVGRRKPPREQFGLETFELDHRQAHLAGSFRGGNVTRVDAASQPRADDIPRVEGG
jgi:hypothetical protein